jgi:non-specific serine/threonine protein kinase
MLEIRLLGKFEIKSDGKSVAIPSRPAQSLFAFLSMNAGISHRREKLAGMLWPDSLEETARSNLRSALWKIRKALPSSATAEYLFADDLTIAFNASAEYWLDAAELETVSENASADGLMTALSLYHGELLPGFYDEWVVLEREHLSSVFEHYMARLMSLLENEHRWLDILDWGERWIKLGQKPEPAYRALMSAHAAKGDMSKVAATYERCVKSLKELGIEPSDDTRALYENLKAEKRRSTLHTNLPVPMTSFIGREKEVEEVVKLVGMNRLVTLAGSGGVGKTRLAIQSSHKLLTRIKDGIWWIDLVGLSDPALVPQAVAKVLDVREMPNQPLADTLVGELQTKQILVVLDNCEHLILACARIADRLLSGTKHLKILATSREALDILGETVWTVPSLSLPDPQDSVTIKSLSKSESVRLFAERATVMQRKFTLTDQNVNAVAQICRRLSGMPLAIELAAARIKLMSIDEIAKRLDDRFSLLTSGNRSALPRQQTLRATIDWSHDLLTEPEKVLFRRLAVFAGGFTLESAESICSDNYIQHSDVLDLLGRLVDKSLVVVDAAAGNGQTRYRFLETIREYALEKLKSAGEETAIRDKHLEYFRRLAEETEPHLYASEQAEWFARTDAEIDNLRAGLDWSIVEDPGVETDARIRNGFQLVGVLTWYWRRSYLHDFIERLEHMLSREIGAAPTLERARALYTLGFFHGTHEATKARPYMEQALDIARRHNDPLTLSWALTHLALVTCLLQEYDSSLSLLEESLALTRELGISGKAVRGMTLEWMGEDYLGLRDEVRAQKFFEESIALLRETNNRDLLSFADRRLGLLMLKQGNYERAEILLRESLKMNHDIGHAPGTAGSLAALAKLALVQGKLTRSAQLYGIVEGRLEVMKAPMMVMDVAEYHNGVTVLRSQLDEKTLENFWMRGRTMTLERAIRFALEEA